MNEPKAYFDPDQDHVLVSVDDLKSWNGVFRERACLKIALSDAIESPKGVVPDSAEPFYDGRAGRVR